MSRQRPGLHKLLRCMVFCSVLSVTSTAWAGDPKIAEQHYADARKAYESGNFAQAALLLEKAHAEDPNLIYQYNRILALQAAKDYKTALRAMDIYEAPMSRDERFNADELKALRKRLNEQLAEQKTATPDVKKDPDPTKKDPDPVKTDPVVTRKPASKAVPMTLIGVGGAAAITGVVFSTGLLLPKQADYTSQADYEEAFNSAKTTQGIIGVSGLVVGAALVGTGVYLLLSSDEAASSAIIAPYAGPDGGGAVVQWRF